MSENMDNPVEGGENLPSSQEQATLDPSKWDVSSLEDGTIKDGQMFGQYGSLADLHAGYKDLQDKHTAYVRDIKEGARNTDSSIETIKAEREASQLATNAMSDLVNQVVGGSDITEDMLTKLNEHNLDVRDLKLNAIDAREAVNKAYDIVGGAEEYQAMQAWAKDSLSDSAHADFNKNIGGASSDIYIQGLYSKYQESKGSDAQTTQESSTPQRISGEPVQNGGVKPYLTQAELLRDVAYINGAGQSDKGARQLHAQRLSKTRDEVIFG